MNVLSLFDGMSCGHIALDRVGINVDTYYAAEIDKYAIQVTQNNYPNTIQLGSVTDWQEWDIDWSSIDLVSGGFPCQAWSVAGKQLGDKDPRGMLFWTMLDIMKQVLSHNPNAKFLMENVKMKKEFEEYITYHTEQALGTVHKHLINSSLVSAQNRQRYYWTNIEGITQPEDKGIVLADILEGSPNNCRPCEPREFKEDSLCHHAATATDIKGNESIKRVYADSGKAPTLSTCQGGHREPKVFNGQSSYRKLTPTECERLQTVPDGYTEGVSNTQRYKMLGNAWTVDVIAHIYKNLKERHNDS
jgi:DNA (cytosine-5)-methyltransferase 1/DNA (cytosine-5)-methyltransferase 3A